MTRIVSRILLFLVSMIVSPLLRFWKATRGTENIILHALRRMARAVSITLLQFSQQACYQLAFISGAANSTNAQIGSQTKLYYWLGASPGGAWTAIANVRQFGEVGADKPEVESTDLDSTGVERIGGLTDGKEISIVCVCNATTLPLIQGFYDAGDTLDLRIFFPSPLNTNRFFQFSPLHFSLGTVTPSGLIEVTLGGRISGSILTEDMHDAV